MTLTQRERRVFARAEDREARDFCIERCEREFVRAIYVVQTLPDTPFSDGRMTALENARRRIRRAKALPWLNYRFLELDRCWLSLLGYRFAWESRWQSGGVDAACHAAEEILELTQGTAGTRAIEDLFRIYRTSKLTGTWVDGGRIYEPPKDWRAAS